jgi:ribonuclease D
MIKTSKDLDSLVERAAETRCIAIDTEFVWERTYYPTLGIVQVAFSREEAFVVDVLAFKDFSSFGAILADPGIVKILHDAQQDLTILRRATGAYPQNIFDTRLAAGFAGLSSTLSLSALVREILGVDLPKTETRSNWLRRPLTEKQIDYAIDDVCYLHDVRAKLLSKAENNGREAWLAEELARYDITSLYEESNSEEQFLRVKGVSRLTPRRKSVLRELASWREKVARERNYPRAWVITDEMLVNLAQRKPQSIPELKVVDGIAEKITRRYGIEIVEAVRTGLAGEIKGASHFPKYGRDDDFLNARVDLALAYMKGRSMAEGIDPALIATRAEITALVREGPDAVPEDHRLLYGWRWEFMGERLLDLLSGELVIRLDPDTGLPRSV